MNIAFVARPSNPLALKHLAEDRYVTEAWSVSEVTENKLKSGRVSLHFERKMKSYIAGNIIATYEVKKGNPSRTRRIGIVFENDRSSVSGEGLAWQQEKALYQG